MYIYIYIYVQILLPSKLKTRNDNKLLPPPPTPPNNQKTENRTEECIVKNKKKTEQFTSSILSTLLRVHVIRQRFNIGASQHSMTRRMKAYSHLRVCGMFL